MKGLLLKDFYNMKENIIPTAIMALCIGTLLAIKGNPAMFVLGVTLAFASISSSCLRMDETAKWGKYEITTPVTRKIVVFEKYILVFVLTVIGLVVGTIISFAAGMIIGGMDIHKLLLYMSSGFGLAMISGSLITFCIFKFGLVKADFFTTICYLIPVGIFVGILVLLKKLGYDFMQELYMLFVVLLPIVSILFSITIACVNVKDYEKKQF